MSVFIHGMGAPLPNDRSAFHRLDDRRKPFNDAAVMKKGRREASKEIVGIKSQNSCATCPRLAPQQLGLRHLASLQDACPTQARGLLSVPWIRGYPGPSAAAQPN